MRVTAAWMTDPVTWAPRRGAASAVLLTRLAAEHGMPAARCLAGTGLTRADLADPEAEISAGQELALIANLVGALGHVPGLGLRAGARYHPTTFGLLGLAAISSPTLGTAVDTGMRYFDLTYAFSPWTAERTTGALRSVIDDRAIRASYGEEVARFLAERDLAAVATFVRDLAGPEVRLDDVRFRHARPSYAALYETVLGVRPSFGRTVTCGTISALTLSATLPQADPSTAELSRRHCERQLRARRSAHPGGVLAARVRADLRRRLEAGGGIAGQAETAARLGLSERSLRRRLRSENVAYSELLAEATSAAARAMLATGRTVESVAAALGYSGTSSFTYAFKRWTGTTPGAYSRAAASVSITAAPTPPATAAASVSASVSARATASGRARR